MDKKDTIKKNGSVALEQLPNIGKVAAEQLRAVGLNTPEDLREAGSRKAFLKIKESQDPGACLNKLCALEGAIQGIRWFHLTAQEKEALRAFYKKQI